MEIQIRYGTEELDWQQWADFVAHHPKGSVFQTPQMYRCHEQTPGQQPHLFTAHSPSGLVGVLLAVVLREQGALKGQFSVRGIIQGGPIVAGDDPHVLQSLLTAYNERIGREVIYTQVRNQFDQLALCDTYRACGFRFEPHLNFLLTLDTEAQMWARIGKGRIKQVKKAQKNALRVEAYTAPHISDELISQGYEVIREVYHHARLPLADCSQIRAARDNGLLVLFVVRTADGTLAGCRFALGFGTTLYGWYAGSHSRYYHLFPNDLLIWETLRWACANGYTLFDYGGAGSPNRAYGVRSFKSQLGGRLVDFGRYERIHSAWRMQLGKLGFQLLRITFVGGGSFLQFLRNTRNGLWRHKSRSIAKGNNQPLRDKET